MRERFFFHLLCLMVWARATRSSNIHIDFSGRGGNSAQIFDNQRADIDLILRQTRRHLCMPIWRHNWRPSKHLRYQLFSKHNYFMTSSISFKARFLFGGHNRLWRTKPWPKRCKSANKVETAILARRRELLRGGAKVRKSWRSRK